MITPFTCFHPHPFGSLLGSFESYLTLFCQCRAPQTLRVLLVSSIDYFTLLPVSYYWHHALLFTTRSFVSRIYNVTSIWHYLVMSLLCCKATWNHSIDLSSYSGFEDYEDSWKFTQYSALFMTPFYSILFVKIEKHVDLNMLWTCDVGKQGQQSEKNIRPNKIKPICESNTNPILPVQNQSHMVTS